MRSRPARFPRPRILAAAVALLLPLNPAARASGEESAPPAWVDRFPHRPDQYVGIGEADKRAHPGDYRDLARASALAQISREISVQVVAANAATLSEDAEGRSESYADRIATATRNVLQGYHLEGVYETEDRFWAFYALDKATWEKAREERELRFLAWLDGEAGALNADLDTRRIQRASDRYARIRKIFDSTFNPEIRLWDPSPSISSAFDSLSGKIAGVARDAHLRTNDPAWRFSLPLSTTTLYSVSLTDAATGMAWVGPFTLVVSEPAYPLAPACSMETDAQGRVDLSQPFLRCGLDPGVWRVTWTGPDGWGSHFDVEAEWKKLEFAVDIASDLGSRSLKSASRERSEPANAYLFARLRSALQGRAGRRYRIVSGGEGIPVLSLRVREPTLDSLEGLYFASLRAEVFPPAGFGKTGNAGELEVRGKGGHTDKDRALAAAIDDFARALQAAVEGFLESPQAADQGLGAQ